VKMIFLLFGLLIVVLLSLSVGPVDVGIFSGHLTEVENLVFWDIRLPRTMTALTVGASLGLGGALLQTLLRNPLAEPYTLGLSGASAFGAVLAIGLELTPLTFYMPFVATVLCLVTSLAIMLVATKRAVVQSRTLILTGVMVSLFFGSLVVLTLSLMRPNEIQTALFWMMGQIGTERDKDWWLVGIIFLVVYFWTTIKNQELDRLLIGEEIAQTLGTSVRSLNIQIIFLVSLIVASCVSVAGLIGFVGLLAPHMSKYVFKTHRHKIFIFGSSILGALLLVSSDVLARIMAGEREIPTGGLVAVMGAPVLIYFLQKRGPHVGH